MCPAHRSSCLGMVKACSEHPRNPNKNTVTDEEKMQSISNTLSAPHAGISAQHKAVGSSAATPNSLSSYQIIRRNGAVVPFEPNKIAVAMMKAFLAVHGTQGAASASVREMVDTLTQAVVRALMRSRPGGGTFHYFAAGPGGGQRPSRQERSQICPPAAGV